MFKTRPCGCKGQRSCKICEQEYGAYSLSKAITKENSCIYCPLCQEIWPGWDNSHPDHVGEPISISGIYLVPDFITPEEEENLVREIDKIPWDLSQSGRFKQNYGPKCNFKKKKVSMGNFKGYPEFTRFIQKRFENLKIMKNFETVEQCSLDYSPERGSSIDPHIDDCWIWGERIPTLSLLSDSVLTLTKFIGPNTKYNLMDTSSYPLIINEKSLPKNKAEISAEYEALKKDDSNGSINSTNSTLNESLGSFDVIRIPMPRRSLLILYGPARYCWEHCILREDVTQRRVCLTYRELTPTFLEFGAKADVGKEILDASKGFL